MRIYDPRVGRFLSVDPLTKKFAELTPYQFASNSPVRSTDLDGLEGWELSSPQATLKRDVEARMAKLNSNKSVPPPPTPHQQQPVPVRGDKNSGTQMLSDQIKADVELQGYRNAAMQADPVGQTLARDPFVQQAAKAVLTDGVANFATKSLFQTSTSSLSLGKQFLVKSSIDVIGQGIFNGPKNIDVFDALVAGTPMKPLYSAIGGAAIDIRPFTDKPIKLLGLNKSFLDFGIEASVKYAFGSGGLQGTLKNQYKGSFNLSDAGQLKLYDASNYLIQVPLSLSGKGASKAIKEIVYGKK